MTLKALQECRAENAALKEQVAQLNLACDHYCETIAQQAEVIDRYKTALQYIASKGNQSAGWCWTIAHDALQLEEKGRS